MHVSDNKNGYVFEPMGINYLTFKDHDFQTKLHVYTYITRIYNNSNSLMTPSRFSLFQPSLYGLNVEREGVRGGGLCLVYVSEEIL